MNRRVYLSAGDMPKEWYNILSDLPEPLEPPLNPATKKPVSPSGSHKPNTAIAQAYYNKISGIKKLTTETGAGQWGSALSFAGNVFGLEIVVYMVKVSREFYRLLSLIMLSKLQLMKHSKLRKKGRRKLYYLTYLGMGTLTSKHTMTTCMGDCLTMNLLRMS